MSLRELSEEECPLVKATPELRTRYNQLVRDLKDIETKQPMLFQDKNIHDLRSELADLQNRLQRPRYLVGFFGLFQNGKSSTLNRILRADDQSRPAFEGQTGGATTASVTRIYPHPPGTNHSLTLRYLTEEGYRERRDKIVAQLASKSRLKPAASEAELLKQLPELIEDARRSLNTNLEDNLTYLQRLLQAYSNESVRRQWIASGPEGKQDNSQPFAQRKQFINHQDAQKDPRVLLLQDVQIGYATEVIPKELELIDLPGRGAILNLDTLLGEQLLPEMDGAFIFFEASRGLTDGQLSELILELREAFGETFQGRVWILFGRCDALTDRHLKDPERNIFTGMDDFLRRNHLTVDQIGYVCNIWDGRAPEKFDEELETRAGTRDLAAKFPEHGKLVEAFLRLRQNGGVDHIRHLVSRVIKEQVEKAARRDLGLRLQRHEEHLETARKLWEERNRFDPQRLQGLHQVWMGVLRVRCQVERRQDLFGPGEVLRDYFGTTAEATERALLQKIDEAFPSGPMLRSMNLRMVSQQFPNHATLLEHELLHLLSSSMLPDIYKQIGDEFATLPRTPVMQCPQGIQARWDELTLADRRERGWLQGLHFPSFLDRSGKLFAGDASAVGGLNGESYREMLVEKIRVVAQQSMHVLRVRVRHHLDALEQAYRSALESQNDLAPQPLVLPQ